MKKPANPTRSTIKPRVDRVINHTCEVHHLPIHPEPIDDSLDLHLDIGFGSVIKAQLSIPLSVISEDYEGGKRVKPADSGGAKTVGDLVDVTHARANGK